MFSQGRGFHRRLIRRPDASLQLPAAGRYRPSRRREKCATRGRATAPRQARAHREFQPSATTAPIPPNRSAILVAGPYPDARRRANSPARTGRRASPEMNCAVAQPAPGDPKQPFIFRRPDCRNGHQVASASATAPLQAGCPASMRSSHSRSERTVSSIQNPRLCGSNACSATLTPQLSCGYCKVSAKSSVSFLKARSAWDSL